MANDMRQNQQSAGVALSCVKVLAVMVLCLAGFVGCLTLFGLWLGMPF